MRTFQDQPYFLPTVAPTFNLPLPAHSEDDLQPQKNLLTRIAEPDVLADTHLKQKVEAVMAQHDGTETDEAVKAMCDVIDGNGSHRQLAIAHKRFTAIPESEIDRLVEQHIEARLKKACKEILKVLCSKQDTQYTVRIGGSYYRIGITTILSQKIIGVRAGISREWANKCLRALRKAGLIIALAGKHGCFRYWILLCLDAVMERLEEHKEGRLETKVIGCTSDADKQSFVLKPTSRTSTDQYRGKRRRNTQPDPQPTETMPDIEQPTDPNAESRCELTESASDTGCELSSHIKDCISINTETSPQTPQVTSSESEKWRGNPDSHLPEPTPTTPTAAAAATNPEPDEEKTSQKKKDSPLFASESLLLADQFAGKTAEFTAPRLRNNRARQLRAPLVEMFRSATVSELYPDPAHRTEACVDVMHRWIKKVKARANPAEHIGFINTDPGLDALAEAQAEVFHTEKERQACANGDRGTRRKAPPGSGFKTDDPPPTISLDDAIEQVPEIWLKQMLQRVKAAGGKPTPIDHHALQAQRQQKHARYQRADTNGSDKPKDSPNGTNGTNGNHPRQEVNQPPKPPRLRCPSTNLNDRPPDRNGNHDGDKPKDATKDATNAPQLEPRRPQTQPDVSNRCDTPLCTETASDNHSTTAENDSHKPPSENVP